MITRTIEQVTSYFRNNKWNALKNPQGEIVFYKNRNPTQIKDNEFLGYSKKRGLISPLELTSQFEEFFKSGNYQRIVSREIVRPKESSTFFMTSGIQYFEESLLKGNTPPVTDVLFVQPVIRTNYIAHVGEGNVSSFVNPSTIRLNCNPEKYVEDLDRWMVFLSKVGLYLGDFNFGLRIKKKDESSQNPWKKNEGFVVNCSYGGLGLGDAGYCSIQNMSDKPFEDIGFGLERLLWARNKTPSFKEVVGIFPHLFQQDMVTIDTLRTLSLMAMSNIEANEDVYNQFKKYLSRINFPCLDIEPQIRSYYRFWKQFITSKNGENEISQYLVNKINKARNIEELRRMGVSGIPKGLAERISEDQDSFLRELIRLSPEKLPSLREMYKK